jgi:hypothetical protein
MFARPEFEAKERINELVRDTQRYQLAQIAQAAQPHLARSYKDLLVSLVWRLHLKAWRTPRTQESPTVPAPKRLA